MAVVPYNSRHSGTPALVYDPSYAGNQSHDVETGSLMNQFGTQEPMRNSINSRTLRSDYPNPSSRVRWGQPVEFDCKICVVLLTVGMYFFFLRIVVSP